MSFIHHDRNNDSGKNRQRSYNSNRPASGTNQFRVFDVDDNTFKVDVFELVAQKPVARPRDAGFRVSTSDSNNMEAVKRARGVPDELQSCHTAVIDGYVIEGHVPAEDIKRLIAERPGARGVAVAGMPRSAPGMDQPGEPYTVVLFGTPTGDKIYATH